MTLIYYFKNNYYPGAVPDVESLEAFRKRKKKEARAKRRKREERELLLVARILFNDDKNSN